ncbi:hypothetical protein AB0C84_42605 [Actinomadura sp. NPDC048955]
MWDNPNTHRLARMRCYLAVRDWLTVFYLPPYALNSTRSKASGHI